MGVDCELISRSGLPSLSTVAPVSARTSVKFEVVTSVPCEARAPSSRATSKLPRKVVTNSSCDTVTCTFPIEPLTPMASLAEQPAAKHASSAHALSAFMAWQNTEDRRAVSFRLVAGEPWRHEARMDASSLRTVPCAVCGCERFRTIVDDDGVREQLRLLRQFHLRRLRQFTDEHALDDRAQFTQDYPTSIVACCRCALVFRNPRPPTPTIERAYAQDRYGPVRLEALHQALLPLYRRKARRLARHLRANGAMRVLEIGRCVGAFLEVARQKQWQAVGIDPGEEVTAFCAQRGLNVQRTTLEHARLRPRSFDAVAVWNTFDQLPDPRAAIDRMQQALRVGGVLAIRVPNGEAYARRASALHGRARRIVCAVMGWNNLLGFPYLHGYSPSTLTHLVEGYGLELLEVRADTLPRMGDDQTRLWARMEERLVKGAQRGVYRMAPRRVLGSPWFDSYYRLVRA